jgi:hypothetical protein
MAPELSSNWKRLQAKLQASKPARDFSEAQAALHTQRKGYEILQAVFERDWRIHITQVCRVEKAPEDGGTGICRCIDQAA